MPPFRPEIKAEIVALGFHADDLILKSQGNYRELEELAETLDNCLDSCNLNLQSIRIIPDNSPLPSTVSMKDLHLAEKRQLYAFVSGTTFLIEGLSKVLDISVEDLTKNIAAQALIREKLATDDEVENFVRDLVV